MRSVELWFDINLILTVGIFFQELYYLRIYSTDTIKRKDAPAFARQIIVEFLGKKQDNTRLYIAQEQTEWEWLNEKEISSCFYFFVFRFHFEQELVDGWGDSDSSIYRHH